MTRVALAPGRVCDHDRVGVVLITGADSIVGAHLAARLMQAGQRLRLMVSGDDADAVLAEFGLDDLETVAADPRDAGAVAKAMRKVDTLYHVPEPAPWRSSWRRLHNVHVSATETVLTAALKAGVDRVVHVSSATSLGPAPKGSTANETQRFSARWGLSIVSATHTGERVALRFYESGLPVVLALPGMVLGRGDHTGSSTEVVRRFIERQIPFYTDGALSIVGAGDVAAGLQLAAEKGSAGERYLFGGRNFTADRLYSDLGRLTGVSPPSVKLPVSVALALVRTPGVAPSGSSAQEVRLTSLWWAYRSNKARDQLGWQTGHHEDPLVETIEWYRRRGLRALPGATKQPVGLRLTGFGVRRLGAAASRLRFE